MKVIVVDSTGKHTISRIMKRLEELGYNVVIFKNLTAAVGQSPNAIIVVGRRNDHIDHLPYISKLHEVPPIYWIYNPLLGAVYPPEYSCIQKIFNSAVPYYRKQLLAFFKPKNTTRKKH